MNMILLATYDNAIEAHLVTSKLESEDISCFLEDENMIALNALFNQTIGGIKLKVYEEDYERAKQLLKEMSQIPYTEEDGKTICCPKCKSTDLYSGFKRAKGFLGTIAFILSFLMFVFPFYFDTFYKCKKCGCEFKSKNE